MNTLIETLARPQLVFADNHLPRDLGDGLVLRFATPADVEALAQFNARIHGSERPDHFDPMVAAWARCASPRPCASSRRRGRMPASRSRWDGPKRWAPTPITADAGSCECSS